MNTRMSRPLRYGVAALAVALAVGSLFIPVVGQGLSGLILFSVLFSAWYGGLGPGLLATALTQATLWSLFLSGDQPIPLWQVVGFVLLAVLQVLISVIVESLHRARRRAEASERWFATALRSIGDAVIATDPRGRVIFVNPVAEALTGWTEAEARGVPLAKVFAVVNEKTRRPATDPVATVLATGRVLGLANHTVLIGRGGREAPIDDSAAPIVDDRGGMLGVVLVFRDVSEPRKAQDAKERLAAIVESSDDVVLSMTLDGIVTSWNRGAERVLGYSADKVVGRSVSMLMPPEHQEDIERILSAIRRGERVDHYRTKRRREDGAVIDVSLTVSPIRDAEGEVVGASKMGRDITDQVRIEAERAEADRRKDEFLAMLAHELRNPLASISNAAQLLGRLEAAEDLDWAKDVVQRQVRHLARLIDDLLDASRITRGKIGLRPEAVDLAPIVASAVEAVRPLVEERRQTLDVSLAPGTPTIEADPLRVEQILVNLLTNAAKYTEAGGRIELEAGRDDGDLVVRVRDTGIGIPPDLLPKIFDLFTQGDRSIARSEGGLGIGLTLVKSLAEMHGGSVCAASGGPGAGSEFTVRLPAPAGARAERETPEPIVPRAPRRSSRILVVDDNLDTAKGLARLLKLIGHEVRLAHDGPTALEAALEGLPEVVLLDIGLPGMDGYQVARKLREDGRFAETLIIAVSGYGQEDDMRRSREAGFNHHLVKPLDYDALATMLAQPTSDPASARAAG